MGLCVGLCVAAVVVRPCKSGSGGLWVGAGVGLSRPCKSGGGVLTVAKMEENYYVVLMYWLYVIGILTRSPRSSE